MKLCDEYTVLNWNCLVIEWLLMAALTSKRQMKPSVQIVDLAGVWVVGGGGEKISHIQSGSGGGSGDDNSQGRFDAFFFSTFF